MHESMGVGGWVPVFFVRVLSCMMGVCACMQHVLPCTRGVCAGLHGNGLASSQAKVDKSPRKELQYRRSSLSLCPGKDLL